MMDEKSINEFLNKYASNTHTEEEHQLFIEWTKTAPGEQLDKVLARYQEIGDERTEEGNHLHPILLENIERKLDLLDKEIKASRKLFQLWTSYKKLAGIAALLLLSLGFFFYFSKDTGSQPGIVVKSNEVASKTKIAPGGNKAVLTLSTGKSFVLDNTKNGLLFDESGLRARKVKEGQLIFDSSTAKPASNTPQLLAYNTITTPRGGQYQVVLPDGTKVWLNAASSLRFAAVHSDEERVVELNGEAYFEVAGLVSERSRKKVPFKVRSGNHVVEVLGTHFNVKAYNDEAAVTTTLLEGSVKVSGTKAAGAKLLKPGQQAKVSSVIKVSNVDATEAIAWKDGYFNFSHENIESIMRNISRWYDVEVVYEKNVTKEEFVGAVLKYQNVSQVLEMLQLTGAVKFKIQGRRITVMP